MALFRREQIVAGDGGALDTVVGPSASLQGVLKADGNVRIDGTVQGRVETAGNVVIGPSARVVANITANSVQVWGHVQGNIRADGRLEILSTGRVFGDLCVAALMIDKGGLFRGQCFMEGVDVELIEPEDAAPLLAPGDGDANDSVTEPASADDAGDAS